MLKVALSPQREKVEAIARLIAGVATVALVVWSMNSGNTHLAVSPRALLLGALFFVVGGILILADVHRRPRQTVVRNVLSITLDVTAVSGGLYIGSGLVDPIALFYLWIVVGSGLVYGARYLYLATALAATGFGLVYVASPYWQSQPMFSATIAGLMLLLGPYLATLLHSLERAQKLVAWQATHDDLTGMLNRREFERLLGAMVPTENPATEHFLLYMDLDRFKEINDAAGHAAGDRVLQDVARSLAPYARQNHLLGRMGGDEFCLLLVDESLENARRCAEQIRNDIASYRLAWGTAYYTLGVSVGVVGSASTTDGDALVRLADAACYAAKNNGRNQVHVVDQYTDDTDTQVIRRLKLPAQQVEEKLRDQAEG